MNGKGQTMLPQNRLAASTRTPVADRLEEIARRLVAIHVASAQRPEGGPELQAWTQEQIEDLMSYVDDTIDLSK